jgi:uncharacterized protein
MPEAPDTPRLLRLPVATVLGREVRVAKGGRARLLIPRCASVHTFGMRFALDLYFLGADGEVVAVRLAVPPRRLAFCRRGSAVLELPAGEGGEIPLARA